MQEDFELNRRKQREHVFKMVFTVPFSESEEQDAMIALYLNDVELEEEMEEHEASMLEIRLKTKDILSKLQKIDETINSAAVNWTVDRMSHVDAAILRVSVYEILFDGFVPTTVAINEAIEIAKKYGGETSPSFVNGVLANVVKQQDLEALKEASDHKEF